jgi:hypothetical protein
MKKKKEDKVAKTTKGLRLPAKMYDKIAYVTGSDIEDFHGKEWAGKFHKAFGIGTCSIVMEKGAQRIGIYYHDYIRFADVVDYNRPTYFD